jgi:hypothetical protein
MISSESIIQGIKSEKETLEVVVAELSNQLMKEREKRIKLEEDMAVLKSQMNAILKSLQS